MIIHNATARTASPVEETIVKGRLLKIKKAIGARIKPIFFESTIS
ncbi:hypothetical protein T190607A01A_20525 [Tenacibaculum sp. 190524A05c]|uniref:Uncharacterized protein n=1 Tax=Tenacibaculum platacis TaxID=3137852 RepID=A0ABM9P015_9FLAO